jgi:large exoprotein involved in heme utilization and adhesion
MALRLRSYALDGSGGRVNITTQQIFGLIPRTRAALLQLQNTDNPAELNPSRLPTNDITAISQASPALNGQVVLNTLGVDPSRGVVELPATLADQSGLIAQTCSATTREANRFVYVGRGGLPPNPSGLLSANAALVDWVDLPQPPEQDTDPPAGFPTPTVPPSTNPPALAPQTIEEAQRWAVDAQGNVTLLAQTLPPSVSLPILPVIACSRTSTPN